MYACVCVGIYKCIYTGAVLYMNYAKILFSFNVQFCKGSYRSHIKNMNKFESLFWNELLSFWAMREMTNFCFFRFHFSALQDVQNVL